MGHPGRFRRTFALHEDEDMPGESLAQATRRASRPWALLPATVGALVALAAAIALALPLSPALLAGIALALAAASGVALAATGGLLHRAIEERRYYAATQEGLIEEVSQEFDRVREALARESAKLTHEAAKVARLSSRVAALEAEVAELAERVADAESPLGRSVRITPTGAPLRAGEAGPVKAEADAGK